MYLTLALVATLVNQAIRKISNLIRINTPRGFDSHHLHLLKNHSPCFEAKLSDSCPPFRGAGSLSANRNHKKKNLVFTISRETGHNLLDTHTIMTAAVFLEGHVSMQDQTGSIKRGGRIHFW